MATMFVCWGLHKCGKHDEAETVEQKGFKGALDAQAYDALGSQRSTRAKAGQNMAKAFGLEVKGNHKFVPTPFELFESLFIVSACTRKTTTPTRTARVSTTESRSGSP